MPYKANPPDILQRHCKMQVICDVNDCFVSPSTRDCLPVNVRSVLPIQLIDATHALNRSAGVSKSRVFLGRSFN